MQFLSPNVLWALFSLAIPIAIHLFNLRRYKTIHFSDTRFLKEVQQSTKRQRKIKEWLVLVSRLLLLFFVVMAFAKPFIPISDHALNNNRVVIALDNSASTQVGTQSIKPLEFGKQMALKILDQVPEESEVMLIHSANTQNTQFRGVEEIREEINQLSDIDREFNTSGKSWQELQADVIFFLSDLQKNSLNIAEFNTDSTSIVIIPTVVDQDVNTQNVSIDSVWLDSPILLAGQEVPIFYRIRNFGELDVELSTEVLTNDLPEISLAGKIKGNEDSVFTATLTQLNRGFNIVTIHIKNDPIGFDNRYTGSFFIPISNQVVEIFNDNPNELIARLFSGNEFQFSSMSSGNIDNALLARADLIILNEIETIGSGLEAALLQASASANIMMIPSPNNAQNMNPLCQKLGVRQYGTLDTSVLASKRVNTTDPYFEDVFQGRLDQAYWPTIKQHYSFIGLAQLPSFRLMELMNGDALFVRYGNGQTNVLQLATPLAEDYSDIASHPVIVPLFIKALLKKNSIVGFTGYVGQDMRFDLQLDENLNEKPLSIEQGVHSFIPRQRINGSNIQLLVGEEMSRKGIYNVKNEDQLIGALAFNIPRQESDLSRYTINELEEQLDDIKSQNITLLRGDIESIQYKLESLQQGLQLWRYALGLALLFLLLEILILRLVK